MKAACERLIEFSRAFAGAATASLVVWHMAATCLYLLPPLFATRSAASAVKNYIEPIFYQNWHFFAPNPGMTMERVIGRCRCTRSGDITVDPFHLSFPGGHLGLTPAVLAKHHYLHQHIVSGLLLAARSAAARSRPGFENNESGPSEPSVADTAANVDMFRELNGSPAVERARTFVGAYCYAIKGTWPDAVDLTVIRERPICLSRLIDQISSQSRTDHILTVPDGGAP